MADEDKAWADKPSTKPAAKKEASSTKKPAPRAASYVVAEGRAITTGGRIIGPGGDITAEEVADIEALIKGGFVVKA